jgi:citrate lyase subunit beta/citryl-CoA lyase
MEKIKFIRSALFVPGNRPDRVDKALGTAADVVIIDLEDAVPFASKDETRPKVREKILQYKQQKVIVRVNGLDSEFIHKDLEEVAVEGLSCIMLPKVEDVMHVREINRLLLEAEKKNGIQPGSISVIPLIESAMGIENAFRIVSEKIDPQRLITVAFGAADFTLDMHMEITKTGEELIYPRARLAVACRAADVDPPLDSPFMIDLKDMDALEADAKRAKQFGYQGKLCIHPNQIDVCNRIFSPTKEEVEFAQKVVQAFHEAEAGGTGVILVEGKFVDLPVVELAKRTLKLSESCMKINEKDY